MTTLDWRFDNSYARLPAPFYAHLRPKPVRAPRLAIFNASLAESLGLGAAPDAEALAQLFSGNALPEGAEPFAQAYAGHQFGSFTMLGDGRALVLGEHVTPDGRRFDIQFKGSGPTPFSRNGDGRAALGPMLREYMISEAMAGLGVPTTRSLAVVSTGETVYREEPQPGAVLTRVASSHLRVGTFQYAAARGDREALKALLDHAVERHDPDLAGSEDLAVQFLRRVCDRQARLIAEWMRVGFVHGVMNTDNMAISGETIDYGPCAFIDVWDPARAFSSIDRGGRYALGNQPAIAQWNLARLAETLLPLIDDDGDRAIAKAEEEIYGFGDAYTKAWRWAMRRKLGLGGEEEADAALFDDLLDWMRAHRADYTNTFRALTLSEEAAPAAEDLRGFDDWRARWLARRGRCGLSRHESQALMRGANPVVIPRNHKVEEALGAAVEGGDLPLQSLLDVMANPYEDRPGLASYCAPHPEGTGYRTFCGT